MELDLEIDSATRPISVPLSALRPYISFTVLESVGGEPRESFAGLADFLAKQRDVKRRSLAVESFSLGDFTELARQAGASEETLGIDELYGFVRRLETRPSWYGGVDDLRDVSHHLTLALRFGSHIAVHAEGAVSDALNRWLDTAPGLRVRRVPPSILEAAYLRDGVKTLNLVGTHPRRPTAPDSKSLVGDQLEYALDPVGDSTFFASSGTARHPGRDREGNVGANGTFSRVWYSGANSLLEFARRVGELIDILIVNSSASAQGPTFAFLAKRVDSLAGVFGPYEMFVKTADVQSTLFNSDLLGGVHFTVDDSTVDVRSFVVRVDRGDWGAELRASVVERGAGLHLRFEGSGDADASDLCDALNTQAGIVDIYFESGHVFRDGALWHADTDVKPFRNWRHVDFAGYDVTREKPDGATPLDIHAAIASPGDVSLFSWVVANYSTGLLICDDGPGEVADFLHISDSGTLSMIHVKAANRVTGSRGMAVEPYQLVTAQALKNIVYSHTGRLIERLKASQADTASWIDGKRVADRTAFIERAAARGVRDRVRVEIVQPQITRAALDRVIALGDVKHRDVFRLRMVETLLNHARVSILAAGGDLTVVSGLA